MVGVATFHRYKCASPSETLINLHNYKSISADRQNLKESNVFENADTIYVLPFLNNVLFV